MADPLTDREGSSRDIIIRTHSTHLIGIVRLALGFPVLFGALVSLVGTTWDIQWHLAIGRDRTLILPHIMILSGILLSGIAALVEVVIETIWIRRNPTLAVYSTSFAGLFQSSLGSYLAGYAALTAAIAFPLDAYWHALYGIDVAIWAPFHVMELASGGLIPLGAAFMLVSASTLAEHAGDARTMRVGYYGAVVAFATVLSIFTLLLSDSLKGQGYIMIGTVMEGWNMFSLFPPLSGLLVAWVLVAAVSAIPQRSVATLVVLVYGCLALLFSAFVPPAMGYLVGLEHLSYRANPVFSFFAVNIDLSHLSLIAVSFWPLAPILVAPLVDYVGGRARRKGWSRRRTLLVLAAITLIAGIPLLVVSPSALIDMIVVLGMSGHVTILGVSGLLISLLLGMCGTVLGVWSGRRMGEFVQWKEKEREW
jgi:hypothetical protein